MSDFESLRKFSPDFQPLWIVIHTFSKIEFLILLDYHFADFYIFQKWNIHRTDFIHKILLHVTLSQSDLVLLVYMVQLIKHTHVWVYLIFIWLL